jgi:O-antigen/teichoic acid export membrane protein
VTPHRRIVRNTVVQLAGEIPGKLLTLVFYVYMARELGKAGYGAFVFSLSLALLTTAVAELGMDGILTREVARRPDRAKDLFWGAIAVKLALGALGVAAAFVVALVGGYGTAVRVAVVLLAVAAVLELLAKTIGATFQAHDDLRPFSAGLLVERLFTAAVGIAGLALGAGVEAIAAIYLCGAAASLVYMSRALSKRGLTPRVGLSSRHVRWLVAVSTPLGLNVIFNAVLFRADATILSLMKSNVEVGIYGVAYQLLEATLFVSYAFVAAILPTLSRSTRETRPSIGETYEGACKVLASILLPLGVGFVFFAEPVIDLVFGRSYGNAATAARLLGGAVALFGLSYLSFYVLISQGRQRVIPWITAAVAAQNVALNLLLIPPYAYDGAAAAASISEGTLAVLLIALCLRHTGRISVSRIVVGPAIGCAGIAVVAAVGGANLPTLAVAAAVYPPLLLVVERRLHPADVRLALDSVLGRRGVS